MSAELLRRAAKLLRERVAYLPVNAQANWDFQATSIHMDSTGTYRIAAVGQPQVLSSHMHATTAQYLITMHPPVALALAASLDSWAEIVDGVDKMLGHIPDDAYPDEFALARAILREEPS